MDGMIFVGGPPYQGKSHFAENLTSLNPKKFLHLEIDKFYVELKRDPDRLVEIQRKYIPGTYDQMHDLCSLAIGQGATSNSSLMVAALIGAYRQDNRRYLINNFYLISSLYAAAEYILETESSGPDQIPIIDTHLIDTSTRDGIFKLFRRVFRDRINFDGLRKMMVYFDQGLGLSLERHRTPDLKQRVLKIDEETVIKLNDASVCPEESEAPNLEVFLINEPDQCIAAIEVILEEF